MESTLIKITRMEEQIKNIESTNREEHSNIVKKIDTLLEKFDKLDERYADKEQFIFWRNLLISGIVLSVFINLLLKI